uniref:Reprolysin n=1 Tax=Rhipicephalus appendiculatus TaxID=34631 RepID=A0A131YDV1_RHIAP
MWLPQYGRRCIDLSGFGTCAYTKYYIHVVVIEDGTHQHPIRNLQAKQVYYRNLFMAVARRLFLLGVGYFKITFIIYPLSESQTNEIFSRVGKPVLVDYLYKNFRSFLKTHLKAFAYKKELVVLFTRRALMTQNGLPSMGFAVKGSMCTENNIAVVHDNGVFSAVNDLVKLVLHSVGVDIDGVGAASSCPAQGGYLMGRGKLKLPLGYSVCTRRLIQAALRRSKCLGSKISDKTTKTIPMPTKIKRGAFCSALGLSECDEKGMQKFEHKSASKYECLVHCCKGESRMERLVAPDGLQCDEDPFHYYDKRCVNGACVQIR